MLIKLIASWFVLLGLLGTITGQTTAYFTDRTEVTRVISIGTWEVEEGSNCSKDSSYGDCRKLSFSNEGFDGQNIFVTMKNSGESMVSIGEFEIYFIENGNPKEGKVITKTLPFQPIKSGQEVTLTYTPNQEGFYIFKSFDGYTEDGIWSSIIEAPLQVEKDSTKKDQENEENIETTKQEENDTNNADKTENNKIVESNIKEPEEKEVDESSKSPISENPFADEEKASKP